MSQLAKRFERAGRRFLVYCLAWLLAARRRPVKVPPLPRLLVVRLDERVGNLVLLTPLLASLRSRFPDATIDVLGYTRSRVLLANHPAVNEVVAFDKRALFAPTGPLRIIGFLRRRHYDLAIDAANPTDPSFTQALVTRFCGSTNTVGSGHGPFARLYSAPAAVTDDGSTHEIDLRLQLLAPLPGQGAVRKPSLRLDAPSAAVSGFIVRTGSYGVLNLGARIREKWLSVDDYALLARGMIDHGLTCVLTWGAQEKELADQTMARAKGAVLAPPTTLADLGAILKNARCVVTCDTGPMHVAVAIGTPTCAIFVSTDPRRYGYRDPPHLAVTSEETAWRTKVAAWLRAIPS